MDQKLAGILQDCFGLDDVPQDLSIETVESWDSMAHVGLIMALQSEFGVSISPEKAAELTDLQKIEEFLQDQGIQDDRA